MRAIRLQLLALAGALIAALPGLAHACAFCGLPPGDPEEAAYRVEMIFLLAAPYAVGAIGALIGYCAYRNARRRAHLERTRMGLSRSR